MPAYYLEAAVVLLGVILMMAEAFAKKMDAGLVARIAMVGLLAVFVGLFFARGPASGDISPIWRFYAVDPSALFYKGLALVTTIIVLLMGLDYRPVLRDYLEPDQARAGAGFAEFFYLPLFTCAGLMWMASAQDLVSIFVALELVTISFYVLVAFMRRNVGSLEAGVKYLILGALSTGFFVYGIAWLFGLSGQTELSKIAAELQNPESLMVAHPKALLFALAMITVGLGFKIAAVPFQIWVPDVYQGAPTPITAYLSVGSKAAGFVVGYRIYEPFLQSGSVPKLVSVLLVLAGATILLGNLAAIKQDNFKRLLAYSSIAHAGFLLLALACFSSVSGGGVSVLGAISLYLAGYLIMTLLCFHVMCLVRAQLGGEEISTYRGLARRSPFTAFVLLIAMISLAGVPLTAGFIGKLFVFLLAIESRHYFVVALAVIGVVAGFYYYLRVLRAMYFEEAADDREVVLTPLSRISLTVLSVATLVLGVYPAPILRLFS